MPRSFGGGGASSSASSGSNNIKNVATLRGLSSLNKNLEHILAMNSNKCPILLDLYEECMSRTPTDYGAKSCDNYREMMASCGEIKRDPSLRRMAKRRKEWEESQQREAIAKGFANRKDYWRHQSETNPKMCRITYELYEECRYNRSEESCKHFRNKCPQFKQAPKQYRAVVCCYYMNVWSSLMSINYAF